MSAKNLVLALGVGFFLNSFSAFAFPAPGNYDSYVLAISYQNDFCVAKPEKPECRAGGGHFGMALHGLWPNQVNDFDHGYQYCSLVDADQVGSDWCAAALDISGAMGAAVRDQLARVMPGTRSCLYNHEWYAHGTCAGGSVATYFSQASTLAARFIALPNFKALISNAAGKAVTRELLMSTLAQDLGPGSVNAAVFLCRKDTRSRRAFFAEVDLTLDRGRVMQFPEPGSLGRSSPVQGANGKPKPDMGTCPANGIIITPPR
ncbi:MAG: hypothetical protein H7301_12390 [Cryobacterium sp.]|nr:hypothetical protein [Oligoflexia bacterium]